MPLAANLKWRGRRQRYIMGAVGLAVGMAVAAGLVLGRAPQGARLVVFVPFLVGALGVLQAHGHT
jgi:hypothetical protein